MAQNVSDNNFQQEVLDSSSSKPVLVDFWADWCGPCKMLSPLVEQIANEKADSLKVVKMDVDANPEISQQYGIMGIPDSVAVQGRQDCQATGRLPGQRQDYGPNRSVLANRHSLIQNFWSQTSHPLLGERSFYLVNRGNFGPNLRVAHLHIVQN